MKSINRFYVVIAVWVVLLTFCAFNSKNVYMNEILIFCGFVASLAACSYIGEHLNEKEDKFLDKLASF